MRVDDRKFINSFIHCCKFKFIHCYNRCSQ